MVGYRSTGTMTKQPQEKRRSAPIAHLAPGPIHTGKLKAIRMRALAFASFWSKIPAAHHLPNGKDIRSGCPAYQDFRGGASTLTASGIFALNPCRSANRKSQTVDKSRMSVPVFNGNPPIVKNSPGTLRPGRKFAVKSHAAGQLSHSGGLQAIACLIPTP